jgi:hypothetical protein
MNEAQRASLQRLSERYGVPFDESHYLVHPPTSCMMPGWAEGWVGGSPGTIYVGCSPEGDTHS